jgi:hypothetical protein
MSTALFDGASAARMVIEFDDPAGLLAIPGDCKKTFVCSGAPFTFANFYRDKGMLFTDGINPPDPALGFTPWGHYHLNYEDPNIKQAFCSSTGTACSIQLTAINNILQPARQIPLPGGGYSPTLERISSPENEPRTLSPHEPGAVIQLVYDPENKGERRPFNLISLVVHRGRLNVGTRSATGSISVYNNLTGGFEWSLIGANNLTRATLEFPPSFDPADHFAVDTIVFEPTLSDPVGAAASPPKSTATGINGEAITNGEATPVELEAINLGNDDPFLMELRELASPALDILDIDKTQVKLLGPALDYFLVRGSLDLGAQSDGVNVASETLVLTFGPFREQIPAGLFDCTDSAECDFTGNLGGITNMHIASGKHGLRFQVRAEGIDLSGIGQDGPVPISLQIGNDLGVSHVRVTQ